MWPWWSRWRRVGDERRQLIVWKAGSFTLLVTVLTQVFDVVEAVVRAQKLQSNPFIDLSVTAVTYFCGAAGVKETVR